MYYGAAYYPEHWPRDRWEIDARMMRDAGFNTVRMGEFAWSLMEPEEGRYDFAWLEEAVNLLGGFGIKSILGTPTAAPPKWLADKHPDIFQHDYKGHPKAFGHRRYYCYNNKNYRCYIDALVGRMAAFFAGNEHVLAWQIDNELGCVDTVRCYCPACQNEFRRWLRARYKDIGELNERWGNVFSNQLVRSFDEVALPAYSPVAIHNPSLALEFRRFSSDSAVDFLRFQRDIIQDKAPGQMVTTNFMDHFTEIDYFTMARSIDKTGMDFYPNMMQQYPPDPAECAYQYDYINACKGHTGFWMYELQSGPPGGDIIKKTPKPGELRRWAYQAIAHGADMTLFFRWRTCLFGLEEYWHGILGHDGGVNRRYEEARRLGAELKLLDGLIEGGSSGARAAIVYSPDIDWCFEIQPHAPQYSYVKRMMAYYKAFHRRNIPVHIIPENADFGAYSLVVLPNFIMSADGMKEKLERYVAGGGTVVMDFRAGAKDTDNRMLESVPPGPFTHLLGIAITDYGAIRADERVHVRVNDDTCPIRFWYDVIRCATAQPLAVYGDDYFAAEPAVTRNAFGRGAAYYIGTSLSSEALGRLMRDICEACDLRPLLSITEERVEVVRKIVDGRTYHFVINHNERDAEITLDKPYVSLLDGHRLEAGKRVITRSDVLVLEG